MTKERILVVEDGEDIQELVRFHLAREGFDVETRATGEDGIAAARANPPDLVVLDRNLFRIPVAEINEAKVLLTLMDGRTVFASEVIH